MMTIPSLMTPRDPPAPDDSRNIDLTTGAFGLPASRLRHVYCGTPTPASGSATADENSSWSSTK